MSRHEWRGRFMVVVLLGLLPGAASALPEDQGKITYKKVSHLKTIAGKLVYFDLYIPNVSKPAPVVALGHGFGRSRLQMAGWGKLLASRGYVAVAPDLPGPIPDHTVNGKVLSGLLEWVVTESKKSGTLSGKVDGARRGVMGHSAGGLASVLAASQDSKIDVVVGLDPVEWTGLAKKAAPKIKVPVSLVLAEPHKCNEKGNAAVIYAALTGPKFKVQVIKGTHCDPEWPSNILCTGLLMSCGKTDPQRQARFRRYAMATLDHVLLCSTTTAPWLGGASAKADKQITALASTGYPPGQLGCAGPADGGVPDAPPPVADRGAGDATAAGDLPPPPEASIALDGRGPSRPDSGTPAAVGDEGCDCASAGGGVPPVPGLVLLILLVALRAGGRSRKV